MSSPNQALGGLPSADTMLLERAPLELVVAEIRFVPGMATGLSAEVGLALRERLRELGQDFPRLDVANEGRVSIQVTPGMEPVSQVQQIASGWQLLSADARVQVTVMPSAVVVQSSKYQRWSVSLRPLLMALLTATQELLAPVMVSRIGLRYVNRFADPSATHAGAWHGRIHDDLLGPLCHPVFGRLVQVAQQQVELGLGGEQGAAQGALLRHGPFIDPAVNGAVSYLLDIDVFDGETRAFSCEELINRSEMLNRTSASLFKAALTPEYFARLRSDTTGASPAATESAHSSVGHGGEAAAPGNAKADDDGSGAGEAAPTDPRKDRESS
jgi:uncharacterized protein (TIGR04255 family)